MIPAIIAESAKVRYRNGNSMEKIWWVLSLIASYRSYSSATPDTGQSARELAYQVRDILTREFSRDARRGFSPGAMGLPS
jgi:hypothetical protein